MGPSIDEWIAGLKSGLIPQSMPAEVAQALFYHLADLGLFEKSEGDSWRLIGADDSDPISLEALEERIRALVLEDRAMIVPYFLTSSQNLPDIFSLKFAPQTNNKNADALKSSSDLSNLHIVRKIGRQLEPFIDLEVKFLRHVQGPRTSKEDARTLLNYLLEQHREKGRAREWEQVSRRRHK